MAYLPLVLLTTWQQIMALFKPLSRDTRPRKIVFFSLRSEPDSPAVHIFSYPVKRLILTPSSVKNTLPFLLTSAHNITAGYKLCSLDWQVLINSLAADVSKYGNSGHQCAERGVFVCDLRVVLLCVRQALN